MLGISEVLDDALQPLVSAEASGTIIDASYLNSFGISDHLPMLVTIKTDTNLIGNDFKKVKPSTINHVNFVEGFGILWEGVKENFLKQFA